MLFLYKSTNKQISKSTFPMQLLIVIVLIALAIGGIAIKMFVKPKYTFTKTCGSSFDPKTGKPMACSCQANEKEACDDTTVEPSLKA